MMARTVSELISSCYTITLDEFLEIYQEPLLIGIGVLDRQLTKPQFRHRTTRPLGLSGLPGGTHHLVGVLIPIRARDGESWKRLTVGRAEDNDLVIDDAAVSEHHCFVKRRGDALVVGDLDSTNGTLVNAKRIKPPMLVPLGDQDIITLGRVSFQFFLPETLYNYLQLCPV